MIFKVDLQSVGLISFDFHLYKEVLMDRYKYINTSVKKIQGVQIGLQLSSSISLLKESKRREGITPASLDPYWTWQLRNFLTSLLITSWEMPANKQLNHLDWIIQHLLKISQGTCRHLTCSPRMDLEVIVTMQHWWWTFHHHHHHHHGQECTAAVFQSHIINQLLIQITMQVNSGLALLPYQVCLFNFIFKLI